MSVFISQLLEESLESPSDLSGIHERVLEIVTQMETGEVGELVTVLKKAQEDLNEQMDFSYFKRVKELEKELMEAVDVVRIMSKTEELNLDLQKKQNEEIERLEAENKELKEQLAIKEAEQEEEANLICSLKEENKRLKEENEKRFDKIKEMEQEVGVAKLVHHQNMGLLEEKLNLEKEMKKLKEENERLKERQMIQNAIASEHINEINDVHGEYGKKIRKLEEDIKKLKEKS